MNWWILLIVLIILAVIGGVVATKSYDWDFVGASVCVICGIVASIILLTSVIATIEAPKEIATFNAQKQYIETHIVTDQMENVALTNKKIELNDWLYQAQYKVDKWGGWTFYPDSVRDLESIQ